MFVEDDKGWEGCSVMDKLHGLTLEGYRAWELQEGSLGCEAISGATSCSSKLESQETCALMAL